MAYIPGMTKSDSPENWLNNYSLLKSEFAVNPKSIEINGKTLDHLYKEWCRAHPTVNSNKTIHDSDECIDFAWYCLKVALEELKPPQIDKMKTSKVELTAEEKEDKPTHPYLAKVWDNEDDDEVIGLVVSEIEIGNPIYKFSVVVENDMMNFIKNAPFSHNNYKHAELIDYDLDSINEILKHIAAKVELRKNESISAQRELEEVRQKQSELLKIKRTLEQIENNKFN